MTRTRLWLFPGILAVGAASLVSQSRTHAQAYWAIQQVRMYEAIKR
jgi:hypothetical protein